MKKVMVTGTFDMLHKGHINMFEQARQHGDYLIIVVARDVTVEKVKGKRPRHSMEQRLKTVQKYADKAILGNPGDKYTVIQKERPDVLCLGYDQEAFTEGLEEELKKRGLKVEVVRLRPYRPEMYKSSIIKEKLKKERRFHARKG